MSPRASVGRIAAVTLALSGVGVVVGSIVGGALGLPLALGWDRSLHGGAGLLLFAALVGGCVGAVAAPVVAWIFLRRVSLGRAIAETALGTFIGGLLGLIVPPLVVPAALVGFLVAGISLHVRTRRSANGARLVDPTGKTKG